MTIIGILNYLNKSIKAGIAGGVESLKNHTFKVQHPEIQEVVGSVKVKFPEVQKVVGKVEVKFPENQKISGQVKTDIKQDIINLIERLNETKSILEEKGIKVKNFPVIPSEIKVSNFPKEVPPNFGSLEKKLDILITSIGKLPRKFPDFPKLPDYPTQKAITFPKSFDVSNLESLKSDNPKEYVPVRLTDGEEFYKAIEEFYQQVSSAVTFTDNQNKKTSALVDDDRHVQVDVLTLPNPNTVGFSTSNNQTNGNQVTKIKETLPTDALNTNPTLALGYDGAGLLSTLTKTIGAVQYRKTLTYTSGVLSGVSEWIQL